MYDDETPTADSAEKWLGFTGWLREKVREMTDKFLQDFSSPWRGEASPRPPQELYDETVKLARQEQKASNQFTVGNWYWVMDEAGNLSTQQDRAHTFLPAALVAQLVANINAMAPTPDPAVIDINTQPVVPGANQQMSAPLTNQQSSVLQNDLTLKYLKSKRR